uniref:Uncharacterized protein n=1 Tax=Cannabis sativa TaxID=3483 RepID=A0A803QP00_CANSA
MKGSLSRVGIQSATTLHIIIEDDIDILVPYYLSQRRLFYFSIPTTHLVNLKLRHCYSHAKSSASQVESSSKELHKFAQDAREELKKKEEQINKENKLLSAENQKVVDLEKKLANQAKIEELEA